MTEQDQGFAFPSDALNINVLLLENATDTKEISCWCRVDS